MLTVRADEATQQKLLKMLKREPAGSRVRLRERVCGVGWGVKLALGLSVGMGHEAGDELCYAGDVPFVVSGGVRMRHGETFEVHREWGAFVVVAVGRGIWQ